LLPDTEQPEHSPGSQPAAPPAVEAELEQVPNLEQALAVVEQLPTVLARVEDTDEGLSKPTMQLEETLAGKRRPRPTRGCQHCAHLQVPDLQNSEKDNYENEVKTHVKIERHRPDSNHRPLDSETKHFPLS
jgi:hypothetical protein